MESKLTQRRVVSELTRSTHGDLGAYLSVGSQAAAEDPAFFAHLVAWNRIKGQVRDSKVALPVIALTTQAHESVRIAELDENAQAHLASLDPRNLVRAVRWARTFGRAGRRRTVIRIVAQYLRAREKRHAWWERMALQHRATVKELYAFCRIKPSTFAQRQLFGCTAKGRSKLGPIPGTLFDVVRQLPTLGAKEAAGTIIEKRIPFLVAMGALGTRAKEPDLVLALIDRMSPTELVTNMATLKRLGCDSVPALRGALEKAMSKASTSKKGTFKATRAAQASGDAKTKAALANLQEKQIDSLGGIDGDWLVLADRSGSMEQAIETGRQVAATLARMVKGRVQLVFFNVEPEAYEVTGKTYDEILRMTRYVCAQGGTSLGCGLDWMMSRGGGEVDGIAIVSDAEENTAPRFAQCYTRYVEKMGSEPPVYLYRVKAGWGSGRETDLGAAMARAGHDLQEFDLRGGVDYHSLPNIVQTMRAQKYSLIDEIMATPLLTLDEALKGREE